MKLHVSIDDNQTDIQIWDDGSCAVAVVDDRRYELDVHESGPGGYLLIHDGHVCECRVEGRAKSGLPVNVVVGTSHFAVTLTDPKRLRGATSTDAHDDEAARILAPMPGKIVRVLVSAGDKVEAGAGIVVVEAMKMQNEMKAPKAGTVVTLNVDVGATVNGGDVLAVIE